MEQRTNEWEQERIGCVTASSVSLVLSNGKGESTSKTRTSYMNRLVQEKLTKIPFKILVTEPIQRGIDLEDTAADMYELREFWVRLEKVGFIRHKTIDDFGASPDRLVNDDGLLEIKCPNTTTHLDFIKTKKPKRQYYCQMQAQMACTGRIWCDFVSYDDRLPISLRYMKIRVLRDDDFISDMEEKITQFLKERDSELGFYLNIMEIEKCQTV